MHATSHHLTRLNVEFADLIATCNKFLVCSFIYNNIILGRCDIQCSGDNPPSCGR